MADSFSQWKPTIPTSKRSVSFPTCRMPFGTTPFAGAGGHDQRTTRIIIFLRSTKSKLVLLLFWLYPSPGNNVRNSLSKSYAWV